MIQARAKLTIDFGNSGTRAKIVCNQGDGANPIKRIIKLSNRFSEISADYIPTKDYSSDTSTILIMDEDVKRGILGNSRVVNGDLATREFYDSLGKPTALDKKYSSAYTKYSLQLVVLFATKTLMQVMRTSSFDSMDITWDIVVLLPAGDLEEGTPIMTEMIRGIKEFRYAYPNVTLPFKVDKVGVFAEGFSSYIGTIFDEDFSVRNGYEEVAEDTTIVIDIGAGTTEILIIKGGKVIRKTLYTVEEGGNQVSSRVRMKAKQRIGGKVSEFTIAEAMQTGVVKSGSINIDISDIIKEEKKQFARNLVSEAKEFFETTSYPVMEIGRALVCGGGAIDSDLNGEKVGSMAEGIVDFMKRLSPNIKLVPLPVVDIITRGEDGETVKMSSVVSPRDLNLLGGSILAEM